MKSNDWWDQVKDHLSLIIATVTAIYIALRLLTVSGFDLENAYGILQAAGTGAVVIGTLTALIAPVTLVIGLVLVAIYLKPEKHFRSSFILIPGVFFVLIGVLTLPLDGLPITLPIALLPFAMSFKKEGLDWQRLQKWLIGVAVYLVFIPQFLIPIWLPTEYLTLQDSKKIEAYVLSEDLVDVTVLTTRPEAIEHFEPSEIVHRTPCEPSAPVMHEPLARLIFPLESIHYPDCPSSFGVPLPAETPRPSSSVSSFNP